MPGFVALILAAVSAQASPSLSSAAPWWEKVTYTISGDGAETCRFESSLAGARSCQEEAGSSPVSGAGGSSGTYTKITIERRFSPGGQPDAVGLQAGDTLLGGRVLALSIDEAGEVQSCKTLVASGDLRPAYGCDEAKAERFSASAGDTSPQMRQAYMTIIVYGHEEYLA